MNPLVSARFAKSNMKIRCERRLGRPGDTTVRVGNTVAPNQVVARLPERVQFHIVPANELLGVPPAAVIDYLQVEIGDNVEMGAVLLQKKGMFGAKTVTAPIAGNVMAVQNGRIILESVARLTELRALVKGRVANFIGNHTVILETQGTLIQGIWSTGVETYGPLKITVESPDQPLTPGSIDKHEEHILVAGTIQDESLLEQAASEEVKGIIVGTMPAQLCDVAGRLQVPLILTDGIGSPRHGAPQMTPLFFDMLRQWEGHDVALLTTGDHNRRPEIVIPHQVSGQIQPPTYRPLAPGQTVRLLRAPYQGQIGQVVHLLSKARTMDTGLKARGAMVALSPEQTVFVPYTNMETIL